MHRYLRIAVSALGAGSCVILIALWTLSYFRLDQFIHPASVSGYFAITSAQGRLMFGKSDDPVLGQLFGTGWTKKGFAWSEWSDTAGGPGPCFPASAPVREKYLWLEFRNPFYIHAPAITSSEILVPYWLLVLLPAALTVLPWISWRFRLRTLLIAVTLMAVFLGITIAVNR